MRASIPVTTGARSGTSPGVKTQLVLIFFLCAVFWVHARVDAWSRLSPLLVDARVLGIATLLAVAAAIGFVVRPVGARLAPRVTLASGALSLPRGPTFDLTAPIALVVGRFEDTRWGRAFGRLYLHVEQGSERATLVACLDDPRLTEIPSEARNDLPRGRIVFVDGPSLLALVLELRREFPALAPKRVALRGAKGETKKVLACEGSLLASPDAPTPRELEVTDYRSAPAAEPRASIASLQLRLPLREAPRGGSASIREPRDMLRTLAPINTLFAILLAIVVALGLSASVFGAPDPDTVFSIALVIAILMPLALQLRIHDHARIRRWLLVGRRSVDVRDGVLRTPGGASLDLSSLTSLESGRLPHARDAEEASAPALDDAIYLRLEQGSLEVTLVALERGWRAAPQPALRALSRDRVPERTPTRALGEGSLLWVEEDDLVELILALAEG